MAPTLVSPRRFAQQQLFFPPDARTDPKVGVEQLWCLHHGVDGEETAKGPASENPMILCSIGFIDE